METATKQTRELIITRTFNAPIARLWKAWTDPEEVKKWWGPEDFTAPVIKIDLKPGGQFLYCMRGAGFDGVVRDHWNVGKFVEIVPNQKIVSVMSFADERGKPVPASHYNMPGDWPMETTATVSFEDLGNGKSRLIVREQGIPEEMIDPASMGWNQSLDKLAAILK